jgi:hypothetical protein
LKSTEKTKKQILTRQVFKTVLPIVASFLIISLYFSREFVEKYSDYHLSVKKQYEINIDALKKIKAEIVYKSKGTPDYNKFLSAEKEYKAAKKKYLYSKKNERISGFLNMKSFLYKLGPNFFWFLLIIFFLYRSFYFERKNIGIKIILITALSLTLYEFYYIFQPLQDLSLFSYYIMGLTTSFLIYLAILYHAKYKDHYINILKQRILKLANFSILNTKEEKKSELINLLDDLKNEK